MNLLRASDILDILRPVRAFDPSFIIYIMCGTNGNLSSLGNTARIGRETVEDQLDHGIVHLMQRSHDQPCKSRQSAKVSIYGRGIQFADRP